MAAALIKGFSGSLITITVFDTMSTIKSKLNGKKRVPCVTPKVYTPSILRMPTGWGDFWHGNLWYWIFSSFAMTGRWKIRWFVTSCTMETTDRLKRWPNHTQTHEWLHSSMLDHIQSLFFTKVWYSSIISQFDLLLHSYKYFNSISQNIKDKWSSAFLSIFHQLKDSI